MGHFEKGAWVEDPFDRFRESCNQMSESVTEACLNLQTNLYNSLTSPTGHFRNGKAMSMIDMMEEFTQKYSDVVRSFEDDR